MRAFVRLAFNDYIEGTTSVYTSTDDSEIFGRAEQLALFAVVDAVSSGGQRFSAQLEHSTDARNWSNKGGSAEINAVNLSTTGTTTGSGYDNGTTPSHCFVRARLFLTSSGSAHVKLWITGRVKSDEAGQVGDLSGGDEFGLSLGTLTADGRSRLLSAFDKETRG
jgi:hypothetical protein